MEKLKDLQANVLNTKLEVSNDKIKQTVRNELKRDFLDVLNETFENAGFDVARTNDGVILKLGAKNIDVFVAVDAVIKNLDYDLDFEINEYNLKLEKQAEREKIRAEKSKANAK